jgi:predicted nucleic acid-binding protein
VANNPQAEVSCMRNILSKSLAFDTNILVYLLDKKSVFHEETVNAVLKIELDKFKLVIAQQSIVELVSVLTGHYDLSLKEASNKVSQIIDSKISIVSPLPQTTKTYLELCRINKKSKNHFDLFLAATLIDNKINQIMTNDKFGFKNIEQLKVILIKK